MDINEAIDKLLREQADQTNLLEALWLLFAASAGIPSGGVQWVESRRCFFGGAMTLFEAIMRIMEPDREATDADLARMDAIAKELARFGRDLAEGRG